jgi:hypothetical protein
MEMFGSSTTIRAVRPIRNKLCGQPRRWITPAGPVTCSPPVGPANDILNNVRDFVSLRAAMPHSPGPQQISADSHSAGPPLSFGPCRVAARVPLPEANRAPTNQGRPRPTHQIGPLVGNRTNGCAFPPGRRGICAVPSSEYFRRQAEICLRLSLISSSEEAAIWLILMARDYQTKADSIEAESGAPKIIALSASLDRETSDAQDEERST